MSVIVKRGCSYVTQRGRTGGCGSVLGGGTFGGGVVLEACAGGGALFVLV